MTNHWLPMINPGYSPVVWNWKYPKKVVFLHFNVRQNANDRLWEDNVRQKWQTLWETSSYRYLCITWKQTQGHFRSTCKFQIDLSNEVFNYFHDIFEKRLHRCWRRMFVTNLRCWWKILYIEKVINITVALNSRDYLKTH